MVEELVTDSNEGGVATAIVHAKWCERQHRHGVFQQACLGGITWGQLLVVAHNHTCARAAQAGEGFHCRQLWEWRRSEWNSQPSTSPCPYAALTSTSPCPRPRPALNPALPSPNAKLFADIALFI